MYKRVTAAHTLLYARRSGRHARACEKKNSRPPDRARRLGCFETHCTVSRIDGLFVYYVYLIIDYIMCVCVCVYISVICIYGRGICSVKPLPEYNIIHHRCRKAIDSLMGPTEKNKQTDKRIIINTAVKICTRSAKIPLQ